MLRHFHLIPERYGQTDRQTDRNIISISHVSVLMRDKKLPGSTKKEANGITRCDEVCFQE